MLAIHAMDARTMKPWTSQPSATQHATALRIPPTPATPTSLDPRTPRLRFFALRLGPRGSHDSPVLLRVGWLSGRACCCAPQSRKLYDVDIAADQPAEQQQCARRDGAQFSREVK